MLSASTGGIGEGGTRRRGAASRPVIAGQCPALSGPGLPRLRIEHRGAGSVHEQLRRPLQVIRSLKAGGDPKAARPLRSAMGAGGMSKSQVSRLCAEIDERVNAFLSRPLEGAWPYL